MYLILNYIKILTICTSKLLKCLQEAFVQLLRPTPPLLSLSIFILSFAASSIVTGDSNSIRTRGSYTDRRRLLLSLSFTQRFPFVVNFFFFLEWLKSTTTSSTSLQFQRRHFPSNNLNKFSKQIGNTPKKKSIHCLLCSLTKNQKTQKTIINNKELTLNY